MGFMLFSPRAVFWQPCCPLSCFPSLPFLLPGPCLPLLGWPGELLASLAEQSSLFCAVVVRVATALFFKLPARLVALQDCRTWECSRRGRKSWQKKEARLGSPYLPRMRLPHGCFYWMPLVGGPRR